MILNFDMILGRQHLVIVFVLIVITVIPQPNNAWQRTKFTKHQQQLLVDAHNQYRGQVEPTARNMKQMNWDDRAASLAQTRAEICRVPFLRSSNAFGENVYVSEGRIPNSRYNVNRSVETWNEEAKYFNYNSRSCKDNQECRHYFQLVWSTSSRLGCGISYCNRTNKVDNRKITKEFTMIVCLYRKQANKQQDKRKRFHRPYSKGPSCSSCPHATPVCVQNLCAKEKIGNVTESPILNNPQFKVPLVSTHTTSLPTTTSQSIATFLDDLNSSTTAKYQSRIFDAPNINVHRSSTDFTELVTFGSNDTNTKQKITTNDNSILISKSKEITLLNATEVLIKGAEELTTMLSTKDSAKNFEEIMPKQSIEFSTETLDQITPTQSDTISTKHYKEITTIHSTALTENFENDILLQSTKVPIKNVVKTMPKQSNKTLKEETTTMLSTKDSAKTFEKTMPKQSIEFSTETLDQITPTQSSTILTKDHKEVTTIHSTVLTENFGNDILLQSTKVPTKTVEKTMPKQSIKTLKEETTTMLSTKVLTKDFEKDITLQSAKIYTKKLAVEITTPTQATTISTKSLEVISTPVQQSLLCYSCSKSPRSCREQNSTIRCDTLKSNGAHKMHERRSCSIVTVGNKVSQRCISHKECKKLRHSDKKVKCCATNLCNKIHNFQTYQLPEHRKKHEFTITSTAKTTTGNCYLMKPSSQLILAIVFIASSYTL